MVGHPCQVSEEAGALLGEHATEILCHPTQASKRFRPDARVLIPRHLEQPFALFRAKTSLAMLVGTIRLTRCSSG
jgi:hypothetical protein